MRRDRPALIGWTRFALTWNLAVVGGGAVVAAAILSLVRMDWHAIQTHTIGPLLMITLAIVLTEIRPLVWVGAAVDAESSVVALSSALVLAAMFLWGPATAVVLQAVATLTGELVKRKATWRVSFNVGQYVLCLAVAAAVAILIRPHGLGSLADMLDKNQVNAGTLLWMAPTWLAYHLANLALVAGVAPVGVKFRESFFDEFWFYTVSTLAVLVISAVIVALAVDSGWPLILVLSIPAFAVYRAATLSARLHDMAHRDQLTGLPNRRALETAMGHAVARANETGQGCALLLLDLNEFKEVNDTLGHPAGDELLKIVSERAKRALRPGDVLVRLGGDEFAVVMSEISSSSDAAEVAQRLRSVISEPSRIGNLVLSIGASVGVAAYPGDAKDQRSLLQRADVAMYLAKANRSGVEIYQPSEDPNSADRLAIRLAFREALTEGELQLHFQPQLDLGTGAVCGLEGLLRWTHGGHAVPPREFIAIAGKSELSGRLTDYVLTRALEEASSLWERGVRLPVSMNISINELAAKYPRGRDLVDRVTAGLEEHSLPPWALRLEVSGEGVLADESRAVQTLRQLAEHGVMAALDDFGTGAASLSMLRRLPLAEVKIDGSLVSRLTGDARELAMVRATIEIAHGFELRVVAEGVEDQATADLLQSLGCDAAQGFLFAKVMNVSELDEWLADHETPEVEPLRALRSVGEG